jgi:dolichyl-phosphate-mannose-protein mannosyltransferase
MGRQLFLHHYLPAHLASTLIVGSLLEFVFYSDPSAEEITPPVGKAGEKQPSNAPQRFVTAKERYAGQNAIPAWAACGVILAIATASWWFFLPLTYGYPGLSVEQIANRKWLGYDLHFAK